MQTGLKIQFWLERELESSLISELILGTHLRNNLETPPSTQPCNIVCQNCPATHNNTVSQHYTPTQWPPNMPWKAAQSNPQCPACTTPVFPHEAYMAADRVPFHKNCLKCTECKKKLTPGNLNTHEGKKLYCQNCYNHIFLAEVVIPFL